MKTLRIGPKPQGVEPKPAVWDQTAAVGTLQDCRACQACAQLTITIVMGIAATGETMPSANRRGPAASEARWP